ncbi:MAG TPA: exodeoxyribonuclease VII large subunit [Candidatus Gemmiger excrementipullorum]|uniref:Exodeoxyribonuclease 7 large subunit n=1 Tax=Candidatus Gemmiger excrementipullorum TaxID=2838610 RepID=A0A9D2BVS5_9FIRM|nr:exodeoxyribonuclease VII large subunit [Candidatus Gemmiger excrementipullorum]
MADYISVSALNRMVRRVLDDCAPLSDVIVCGELSGFTRHYKSGHLYFTLKDENASVKGVMFRGQARLLNFEPQNGMRVLAYGRATLYERDGAFQLYVDYMRPFGAGAAQMAFEALYKKLEAEGLFAPERKRPLPPVPRCIGVVTSKTGAAWQDVQTVIARRWPQTKLLLAPVTVQGLEAERSIVAGIRALDRDPRPEVILVTRGGGSKEDLWIFNSERIARAAAACRKPLVSAVGHEIDTTILDYVADLRAPTPSAAAELCVPDRREFLQKIAILQENIQKSMQNRLQICYNRFSMTAAGAGMQNQRRAMARRAQDLERVQDAVQLAQQHRTRRAGESLRSAAALAQSLNPYGILARGYAIVTQDGAVRTVDALRPGQNITLHGAGAEADCIVQAVRPQNEQERETP